LATGCRRVSGNSSEWSRPAAFDRELTDLPAGRRRGCANLAAPERILPRTRVPGKGARPEPHRKRTDACRQQLRRAIADKVTQPYS
jgi:hypothetical protein